MDDRTKELVRQLKDELIVASDGQVADIIREARDEALAEAKAIIKEVMVQATIERVVSELEGAGALAMDAGKTATRASTTGVAAETMGQSQDRIREEMEAIKRKMAENEMLLSQMGTSLAEAEGAQDASVEPSVEKEGDAPEERSEEEYGYYVYGIVERNGSRHIDGMVGIDVAYRVSTLRYRGIEAIVSKVSLQEFGQEALEANVEDMEWLEAKVLAHQGILETVLASRTLIPMRLCTIYRSESRVQETLAQHYDDFVGTLAWLADKQEWGVKVYCDGETLGQRVEAVSDRVKGLRAEILQKSSGAAYFLKKKMDETIAEEVERISDEYAQRSHDRLSGHAEEAVINPLQSREITGRKEAMVLNGAYLVAEEQLAAFQAKLASLEEEYGDLGFSYEMTGPWPPYNFVSISSEESAADE